ncbi:class IIb bacteriocin, lactobin A/cerein 7B family [Erythrobacter sp. SCSIO 43205]|uniref:class IIb bacteriocin, lactobin A/cerein 7B family n=1 Tax=Erythrobacter sp. SCSIO 43205 TaxID=2779361 RepID=UPI001CA9CB22|nr:class IIb bacteriocin, lactobin A/cerein 7B family [Erythrobacter sp. SCSIO 43205]UAB79367.1 class IIb bacteriocin, lactobin A/cerein 7B family [Erythrobacter sp. SCSIO 43205]
MSNMQHDAFAQNNIKELSFDEVEEVNGGGLPVALFVVFVAAPFVAGVIDGAAGNENKTED